MTNIARYYLQRVKSKGRNELIFWTHKRFHITKGAEWCHRNSLQCRHYGHDGISNHQPYYCLLSLLNRLFIIQKHQSSTSLAFVRGIHRWLPRTKGSDAENVSIWWRYHVKSDNRVKTGLYIKIRFINVMSPFTVPLCIPPSSVPRSRISSPLMCGCDGWNSTAEMTWKWTFNSS